MDDKDKTKRSLLGPAPAHKPVTGTPAVKVYNRSSNYIARDAGTTQNEKQNNKRRPKKRRERLSDLEAQLHVLQAKKNAEFIKELEEVYFIVKTDHTCTKEQKKREAQFYCEVCKVALETPKNATTHAKGKQHRRQSKKKAASMVLSHLPLLSTNHIQAIDKLLMSVVKHYGLNPETDLPLRHSIAEQVYSCLCQKLPECSVTVYGSSCSGFGLKDSDVNLDLHVQKEADIPKSLVTALEILQGNSEYKNVTDHFDAKFPRIIFEHVKSGLSCELSAGFGVAPATSRLLKIYADIDPVVRQLVISFRYWAKLCEVDRQGEGSLPAHSLALMVIQFLQHIEPPVLPLIDPEKTAKMLKEGKSIDLGAWKPKKKYSLGQLWIELFRYYCITFKIEECVVSIKEKQPLTREAKKWGMRRIAIEDPFVLKRNIASCMTSERVFIYFMGCLRSTLKYFCSIPEEALQNNPDNPPRRQSDSNISGSTDEHSKCEAEPTRIRSSTLDCSSNLGNTTRKHNAQQDSGQARQGESKTKRSTQNNGGEDSESESSVTDSDEETIRKGSTEDQKSNAQNVRSVDEAVDIKVEDVTNAKLVQECVDARQPASGDGDDDDIIFPIEDLGKTLESQTDKPPKSQDGVDAHNKITPKDAKQNQFPLEQGKSTEALTSEMGKLNIAVDRTASGSKVSNGSEPRKTDIDPKSDNAESHLQEFDIEHKPLEISRSKVNKHLSVSFKFEEKILRGGMKPRVTCSYCKLDGHVKDCCPEEMSEHIPLMRLPPVTLHYATMLERVCRSCKADFALNQSELHQREKVLRKLEDYIHETYPGAKLHLFGSSKNGLGFQTSDLDICMTMKGKQKEDLDCIEVILTLSKKLKKHKDCSNVLAITTAKVPIVKFYLRSCQREADISLYNTLALENTRLLALYCSFDERVNILGYTVKVFAKTCDIGDASKGSLSSYAYILMLLHFLQQRGVVPVFQELYSGDSPPQKMIEGWNCWFNDDISNISKVWTPKDKNRKCAGELWLDFLSYYSEEFDFDLEVVCCRRQKRLTKFEKMWTKPVFAIEDPFNLDHNLGGGISRRMGNFILHAFRRARERFGMPWPQLSDMHPDLVQQYFFNPQFLNDGDIAPTDRNCRVCGRIGHIAKDCPKSNANRRAEKQREEQEQQHEKAEERSRLSNKPFANAPPMNDQLPRRWSVPVSPPRPPQARQRQKASPNVDAPQRRVVEFVEEQPGLVSRPIQQPPLLQRQLQFVQPFQPLPISPPRQSGWPVPLYPASSEVEAEARAAQASPNKQLLEHRNSEECSRGGPAGKLGPHVCMPQTLEIQSQPVDTGRSTLPYPQFEQQSRDTMMSPGTPQTPALYYCTSPPGFIHPGRTRSRSDSGLVPDMQIQCQQRSMAVSAPLLFFPQAPQGVFRNDAWPPLHGPTAAMNQPSLRPHPLQAGFSPPVANSPLQQSVGSPPLLSVGSPPSPWQQPGLPQQAQGMPLRRPLQASVSPPVPNSPLQQSVGSPPLLSVGSPPSPWQQPGLPQAQHMPLPQTVLGGRMTANQFFELIKRSEQEQKKREKTPQLDGTSGPPPSTICDVKLEETQGSPNRTWNEDQLAKMVKSDKVRALWGSKESGEEITTHNKPGDADTIYKEPRNPDDSGAPIPSSDSSNICLHGNTNNPEQDGSTGKALARTGNGLDKSQTQPRSLTEHSQFEKPEGRDSVTSATDRVEGTDNETKKTDLDGNSSGHEMDSEKEIKQEKKKRRTRRGARSRGGRTSRNDLEGEEGVRMTKTQNDPNKVDDSASGTPDGKKISRKETAELVEKSKGSSVQQANAHRDDAMKTRSENRTQESKKDQQKEHSGEMQSNQKKKPSRRQHANSWSERGSQQKQRSENDNQKQRDLKKRVTKVEESGSSNPKNEQARSAEPQHVVQKPFPVDSGQPSGKSEPRDYHLCNKGRGGRHRGTRGGRADTDDKGTEDAGSSNRGNSSRGRGAGQQRGGGGNRSARGRGGKESRDRSHSAPQSQRNAGNAGTQHSSQEQQAPRG